VRQFGSIDADPTHHDNGGRIVDFAEIEADGPRCGSRMGAAQAQNHGGEFRRRRAPADCAVAQPPCGNGRRADHVVMPTGFGIIGHVTRSRIFDAEVAELCEKCRGILDLLVNLQSTLEEQRLNSTTASRRAI